MNPKYFLLVLLTIILSALSGDWLLCYAQEQDSTREFFNYRRTDPNLPTGQAGNLPPTEKYAQPKKQVFPLGWNTGTLGKVNAGTGVWTELNPLVPRVDYIGIDFINADIGWVCGGSGAIIKTTNGGQDWTISETPVNNLLLKMHSYNGQVVIATGYDGIILRSSDSGETFELIPSGVGNGIDLWGVQMLNDTLGWVCGMNQTLLKTTDTGLTWQMVTPGLNQHYWSLDFLNEQYGMIACGSGIILKTTNGGNSWTQIQAGDTRAIYTIDIIDTLHIAAAGGPFGKNIYSSDGGITWVQNNNLGYSSGANWIQFINRDTGYVTGDGPQLRKTTNRGQSWSSPVYNQIGRWQFQLLPESLGYGVGDNLTISKTENGYDSWERLIMNDNFSDVFFLSESDGFILSGSLYKTTDSGTNWERIENAPGGQKLIFINDNIGFIGGVRLYKTSNGGNNWNQVNVTGLIDSTFITYNDIFFINQTTGWAVTTRGGIVKTTDGGNNWFAQLNAGILVAFNSIYFVDSLYGWTANSNAKPYKTIDGGSNWVEQSGLDILSSRDVFFINYLNGFILESNKLYKTTDGGITFILIPGITGFSVAAKFSNYFDSTIFITGYKTYRSIDGGSNWFDFLELTGIRINGLSLLGMGNGFAVGEFGIVLLYRDDTVPVELVNFNVSINDNKVLLNWSTASETNNQGFVLEGKLLIDEYWNELSFIPGKGTTTESSFYTYTDKLQEANTYQYRLKQIDFDGTFTYSETINIEFKEPLSFHLSQNYPNPFNPTTTIKYDLPKSGNVELVIYDILGRKVKTLVNETKEAGRYEISWNASAIASGVYVYQLRSGNFVNTKKMVLPK